MNTYPPLSGGITAISSAACRKMTAASDRSIYSLFNANNILFCIGCNLHMHTVTRYIIIVIIIISICSRSTSEDMRVVTLVNINVNICCFSAVMLLVRLQEGIHHHHFNGHFIRWLWVSWFLIGFSSKYPEKQPLGCEAQVFYRPDALTVIQPTVSKNWRKLKITDPNNRKSLTGLILSSSTTTLLKEAALLLQRRLSNTVTHLACKNRLQLS